MVEVSSSEWDFEIPDITEFLRKFSSIAESRYVEFGLAGYIAVVTRDSNRIFHIAAQGVNEENGKRGWDAGVSSPIERGIAALTGVQTRERLNTAFLNSSCVLCSMSDDGKGDPPKNDERDLGIIREVLVEMCGD